MEFESWVAVPLLSGYEGNFSYSWNLFEVKETQKGLGVFARMDMDAGWMLPYGGVELDEEMLEMLSCIADGQTNESGADRSGLLCLFFTRGGVAPHLFLFILRHKMTCLVNRTRESTAGAERSPFGPSRTSYILF